jgi:cytoskeletal protein CcmA (bactofilin family)
MRKRLFGALGVAFLIQAGLFAAGQASATAASQPYVCGSQINPGQIIKGDVIVPSACTIQGTVQGDVYNAPRAHQIRIGGTGLVKCDVVVSNLTFTLRVDPHATVTGDVQAQNVPRLDLFEGNIDGDVEITTSTGDLLVSGNQVGGDVTITYSRVVEVSGNVIQGDLDCEHNGTVSVSNNDVHGGAFGQCIPIP